MEQEDRDEVRHFLETVGRRGTLPATGLLGKLVGDLVAVLAMEITDTEVKIDDLVVATELRRKRIGRVMLIELEQIAAKMERRTIVVERAGEAREFFRRVGFVDDGERLVRRVG